MGQEGESRLVGEAGLLHRLDRHVVVAEDAGDGGEHARLIQHVDADVEGAGEVSGVHALQRRVAAEGHVVTTAHAVARRVQDVAEHRRGRRRAAGPLAQPHEGAADRALDEHRIHGPVHRREGVLGGDHRGVGPTRDAALAHALGHAEQLDDVAGTCRELNVDRAHVRDALARDLLAVEHRSEGERGEDLHLGRRVERFHVRGGIGFGVAELLGFLQDGVVVAAFAGHLGQYEVRRAIHDAHDPFDALPRERRTQGAKDGDTAGDGRFVEEVSAVLVGEPGEGRAALGHQGLVGRHDRDAVSKGRLYVGASRIEPAHQFNENVQVRTRGEGRRIGAEQVG